MSALPGAVRRFLDEHPLVEQIDLLLPDLNGIARGKRLPVAGLAEALRGECFFPTSLYAFETTGRNVEGTSLVWGEGDADRPVALDPATLRPIPWRPGAAQIIGGVADHDGTPFFADPRRLVRDLAARFEALGLKPCAALELEFHLLDLEPDEAGRPQAPYAARLARRATEIEMCVPERMEDQEPFLELVESYCAAQGLVIKSSLAEFAPSQLEINLGHSSDLLRIADEALMLKRCVKAAARATGQRATFMAKPFAEHSGSGLHVHLSLIDGDGRNVFGETAGGEHLLRQAIGGLQATMAEAMLVMAPNANSYRRLRPQSYAPTTPSWGTNNRTVALRIPPGPAGARRVEHRVAGADANPYLVLAAVLAGVLHGLAERLEPSEPTTGYGYAETEGALPLSWEAAIAAWRAGRILPAYVGERLHDLFAAHRASEYDRFQAIVTPTEHAWYLAGV